MKSVQFSYLISFFFFCSLIAQSQSSTKNSFDYFNNNWSIGVGINVVGDAGDGFKNIFNSELNGKAYWNYSNPLVINAEYYLNNKFSFESVISLNAYKAHKIIDGSSVSQGHEANYISFDLLTKYSFRSIINSSRIDPFLSAGLGYTHIGDYQTQLHGTNISNNGRITGNLGFGLRFWFSNHWGVHTNAIAKFGTSKTTTNHQQYNIGFTYLFSQKDKQKPATNHSQEYEELIKGNYKKD
ncbi:porin family protein [Seonamhaeicola sp. MEBiC1930]|uniref:hypothetical protein n=1 Tax=Seonamhaeicola sp. MEBiC01930 TaxID=2976768 RepID=UPI00324D491E